MVACRDSHLSALWHGDPAYKGFSAILAWQSISQPTSNRSHPSVPPGPRHGDPAYNALSGTPACQTGHLSALWHGNPAYKGFSAIPACQSFSQPTSNRSHPSVPPGPRHGDPTHNDLSATPAWRSVLLTVLRHGDPAHRCLSGILAEPL